MRPLKIVVIGLAWLAATAATAVFSSDAAAFLPERVSGWVPAPAAAALAWTWKGLAAAPLAAGLVAGIALLARRLRAAAPARGLPVVDLARPGADIERPLLPKPPAALVALRDMHLDHFVGRHEHRTALTKWLSGGEKPICALVGAGGLGKTALAWAWMHADVLGAQPQRGSVGDAAAPIDARTKLAGVIWWSFAEPGSGFAVFIDEAVAYLSGGGVQAGEYLSSMVQKVQTFLELIQKGRYLIILDGIERELGAFAALDAAYQGDAHLQDPRGEYRTCASPHLGALLRRLVTDRKIASRILITGRLLPKELIDPVSNQPLAGCRYVEPGGLSVASGGELLERFGVEGRPERREALSEGYGGHPLALRVIAGMITGGHPRGRLRGLRRFAVPREHGGEEHRHALDIAYRSLDRDAKRLLGRLAALRGRMRTETVTQLNPFKKPELLQHAISALVGRRLLSHDPEQGHFDMHPLVRHLAYRRLKNRREVHEELVRQLAAIEPPVQVKRFDDLQPSIQLYHHLVSAGRTDEACGLLKSRISKPLVERFADHQTHARLLHSLFRNGEEKLPALSDKAEKLWAIEALANACSYSGQTRRAAALVEANLGAFNGKDEQEAQSLLLGIQAGLQTRLGHLQAADGCLRSLLDIEQKLGREAGEAVVRSRLGLLLAYRGCFDEADAMLEAAYRVMERIGASELKAAVFAYAAQRELLMKNLSEAVEAARRARAEVEKAARSSEPDEHDFVRSGLVLGSALVAEAAAGGQAARNNIKEAEPYLSDALSRCRRSNLIGFEPDLLIAMARWHKAAGRPGEAQRLAEEALAVADRCEYRLKQAEIHNLMAQIALDQGENDTARQRADLAKKRAICDGTPHAYQTAIDEAQAIITQAQGGAAAA